ncbi:MAG: YeeE/YedE thiosulfate transporter family protein [Bacteroidota bacterium]
MQTILNFLRQPWHWSISGATIALVMFLLLYLGQRFGVSSSFRALCSIGGAGKKITYFNYDWRSHDWLLIFILGGIIGGFIGSTILASPQPVQLSVATVTDLTNLGVQVPANLSEGSGYLPMDLFNFSELATLQGFILMVVGGFLIGFGTRWAGGCTSGHAISGLSNLQLPSLVAVIGFFIGGLLMTHFLFPLILSL